MGLATEYASLVKSMRQENENPLTDILKGFETGSRIGKQMADTQSKQAEMKMAEILFPLEYQANVNKVKASELQISKAALGLKEQEKKIDDADAFALGQAKAVERFDNTLTTEGDYDYSLIANMAPPAGMTPREIAGWRDTQKKYLDTWKGQIYSNEVKNIEALNAENELIAQRQEATIKNMLLKKGMEFTPENAQAMRQELIRRGELEQQLDERRKIADVRVAEAKGEKLKASSTKTPKLPSQAITAVRKLSESLNSMGGVDDIQSRENFNSNLDTIDAIVANMGYDTSALGDISSKVDELAGVNDLLKSASTKKSEIEQEIKDQGAWYHFGNDDKIAKLKEDLSVAQEAESEYRDRANSLKSEIMQPLKSLMGAKGTSGVTDLKPTLGTSKSQADVVNELADELSGQVEEATTGKKTGKVKLENLPKQYQDAIKWLENNKNDPNAYLVRKKINDYISSLEK